jgi:hypothetical protein
VLARLFGRLFLEGLAARKAAGRLAFFGDLASLSDKTAFEAVLAYLARYTHRVAIANSRLLALDEAGVTFKYKDYRVEGRGRFKTMTLEAGEFIRRFLMHVPPSGFHRIRHYGLFASAVRAQNIARVRQLLAKSEAAPEGFRAEADSEVEKAAPAPRCPCCGGRMIIIETFGGRRPARGPSPTRIRIDTS